MIEQARALLSGRGAPATLLRGASGTLVSQALAAGVGFVLHLVLSRTLGVQSYGYYTYALSWVAIAAFLARLGFHTGLVRFLGEARARADWGAMRGVIRWALAASFATSVAVTGIAELVVRHIGLTEALAETFRWALLALPLLALLGLVESALRGLRRPATALWPDAVLRNGLTALGVLAAFALFSRPPQAPDAMRITLVAGTIALGVGAWMVRRALPDEVREARPETTRWREWLGVAMPLLLLGGTNLIGRRADVLMLGAIVGTDEAGFYTAAGRYADLLLFPLYAVNAAAGPLIAELHARGQRAEIQRTAGWAALGLAIVTLPLGIFVAVAAVPLLAIFGDPFVAARGALLLLVAGQLVNALCGSVVLLLTMTDHQRIAARIGIATAVSNVALDAALIPFFGMAGAAAATAATVVGSNLAMWVLVRRRLGIDATLLGLFRTRER